MAAYSNIWRRNNENCVMFAARRDTNRWLWPLVTDAILTRPNFSNGMFAFECRYLNIIPYHKFSSV